MTFGLAVFRKTAQELTLPGVLQNPVAAGIPNRPAPQGWTPAQAAPSQNVFTSGQLGVGLLGSLFGEDIAALAGGFLPLYAPILKEHGFDVGQQHTVGIGPSKRVQDERSKVAAALTNQNFVEHADLLKGLAGKSTATISSLLKSATDDPGDQQKIDALAQKFNSMLESASPQALGLFVQQAVQAVPEVKTMVLAAVPEFVFDYTPLVDLTYRQNGGQWDEKVFARNKQMLDNAYQTTFVPAGFPSKQSMLYAAQVASEQTGSLNAQAALNVARSAQAFMDAGITPNFDEALGVISSLSPQAAVNPTAAIEQARWIEGQSRRYGIDPQQFTQAAALAKERNIPVSTAMAALTYGTRMQKRMGREGGNQQLGNTLGQTYADMGKSQSMKVLQAAVNAGKISEQDAIAMMGGAGNSQVFQSRIKGLLRDRTVAQTWKSTDPSAILNRASPENVRDITASDAYHVTAASRGGSRLAKMLQDPSRAQLLAKGVYRGLSPQEINFLNTSAGNRALAASTAKLETDASYKPKDPVAKPQLPSLQKETKPIAASV